MSGVIIDRGVEQIPGLICRSWIDDPRLRLRMGQDGEPRPSKVGWLRAIVLHTTLGIPGGRDLREQHIRLGLGPRTDIAAKTNAWWSTNGKPGGAHLVVDFDGSVACLADLWSEQTYHASSVNPFTIGIEIAQREDASLYEGQLSSVVALLNWLTERFMIQRQIPKTYRYGTLAPRIASGGRDVVGVYGHRDQTLSRGAGDPGDAIFDLLDVAGYERLDFKSDEDLDIWKRRQRWLRDQFPASNSLVVDGVPGKLTAMHIRTAQLMRRLHATGVLDDALRDEIDAAEGDP